MKKIIKYIILFILILIFQIFLPLDLDEIWNYGFAHNIATGLIPYKDFNMVITPLYPFLCSIFLIIKSNLIIVQILQSILILVSFYLCEKMYKEKANILLILLFCFFNCIYPSYNSFLLFLLILLCYLESSNKNDYIIGFILGLMILTKQSVGICILTSSILYLCINKKLNKIPKRLIGVFIPVTIFVIYLFISNSYNEFLDLCIYGLYDFGKYNRLDFNFIYVLFLVSLIIIIYLIIKKKDNYIYWYLLAFLSIDVPMFDINHFNYFIIVFTIFVIIPKIKNIKINYNIITIVVLIGINIIVISNAIEKEAFYYPNKVNHFEYKYISKKHEKELSKIKNIYNKYKNYNIVFLSRSSYLYKIMSNKKITYLDLISKGNFGYNGKDKLYKELDKQKNTLFVVQTTFTKNDQTDTNALVFVNKNCKKIDEFDDFKLYIRK